MPEEEAIEIVKKYLNFNEICGTRNFKEALEIVLNLLKKKDKEVHCLEQEKQDAWEEWNNLEQSSYEEGKRLKVEIKKKDKIIDEIISFLVTRTWATCPNEDCGANIDCKKRCKVDIEEECWKIYFENKVNSSEQ